MKKRSQLLFWIVVTCAASCSKSSSNNSPNQPSCRIGVVNIKTGNSTEIYRFNYDQDKKLIETQHGNSGGFVKRMITHQPSGPLHIETFSGNNLVHINSADCSTYGDGTLKHITEVMNVQGAVPGTIDYAHDNNGFVFSRTAIHGTDMVTTLYKWDDHGNIVCLYDVDNITVQPKGDSTKYEYYLDKIYDPDNVDELSKSMVHVDALNSILTYAAPVYNTRNLLRSKQVAKSPKSTFQYEFDAEGKLVKTTVTSDIGATNVMTYEYICD